MNTLIRAELLKLRSTPMLAWLLLATLAMVVLTVAFSVPSASATNNALSLHEPALLARIVGVSFGVPQVTMVLLGVLAFTQEVRYGTITSTFLVEPRRPRVLVAKGVALVLAGIVIAAATLVVSFIVSIALIHRQDGNVTFGAELWQVVVAAFVVMVLYGVIGLAVGTLLRNQIVAVVAALVWLTAVGALAHRCTPGGRAVDTGRSDVRAAAARPRSHHAWNAAGRTHRRAAPRRVHDRSGGTRARRSTTKGRPVTSRSSFAPQGNRYPQCPLTIHLDRKANSWRVEVRRARSIRRSARRSRRSPAPPAKVPIEAQRCFVGTATLGDRRRARGMTVSNRR